MGKAIGFDLGSSCTAYCDRDNKDIMMMPSIIACDRKTKQTLAVGSEARKMIGRTPSSIELIRPIRGGIITDIDSTSVLLGEIADLLGATSVFKKADRYVAIPFGISKSDENAFKDAILAVGLGTINYVDTAKAIALGAGMPLDSTAGRMIVDIGASCATASIISHGDVVISGSAKYAGDAMTSAIADYITEVHGIEVGELTAEAIKIKLGTLDPTSQPKTLKISGKAKPDKNPKLAQWVREGGLFFLISNLITLVRALMMTLFTNMFVSLGMSTASWGWPNLDVEIFGASFTFNIVGYGEDVKGFSYFIAFVIASLICEVINFFMQRKYTFRSNGNIARQGAIYFVAWVVVTIIVNSINSVWTGVAHTFNLPAVLYNLLTTVIQGGVSMVVFFFVNKIIFTDAKDTVSDEDKI